ncbi:hypothetical protein TCAL_15999, partial [Tigriopus californicus]
MISSTHFRKKSGARSKKLRNVRTTRLDSEDEDSPNRGDSPVLAVSRPTVAHWAQDGEDDDPSPGVEGLQSKLAQIRERKKKAAGLKAASQHLTQTKKPSRDYLGEDGDHEDEDEGEDEESSLSSLNKRTTTTTTTKQLLSFGADEEEEVVFQVKKSSQSRKIMKQKKAERKRQKQAIKDNLNGSDSENDGPISQPALKPGQSNVIEPELDIKLNHTLPSRPDKTPQSWILSGRDAEAMHMEEEDEEEEEELESEEKNGQGDPIRSILTSGVIPDAMAIYQAKKKRQKAREAGPVSSNNRDYIPIDSVRRSPRDDRNGGGTRGRLVREGESDDDDEGRISFTVQKDNKSQALRATVDSGEEDLADAWEEQQYRKVLKSGMISAKDQAYYTDQGFHMNSGKESGSKLEDSKSVFSNMNVKTPLTYNLQGIKNNLKERLESLNEVHRRHQNDADKSIDSLVNSQSEIERLEVLIPQYESRYKFFQELRSYVSNLVECFNEKRQVANKSWIVDVKTSVIKSSSSRPNRRNWTSRVMLNDEDEPLNEKAGGRRRHQQRLQSQAHLKVKYNEGMSSDDELSTSDQANLRTIRQDVENQARTVLADVVEEFSTVGGIKKMMGEWKRENGESYSDAYVSLCLPKMFSPLVRLQLLFWNPFANTTKSSIWNGTRVWPPSPTNTMRPRNHSPRIETENCYLYWLKVPNAKVLWHPVTFIKDYPTLTGQSKQLRTCLTEIRDKLKAAVDHDVYIPIGYMKQVAENPSSPHAQFWQEMLGDKVLADLAVSSLLNKYLLIGLGMNPDPLDALVKTRQIVSALPSSWREIGVAKEDLGRFAQFLATLSAKPVGPDGVRSIVEMLKLLNYQTE